MPGIAPCAESWTYSRKMRAICVRINSDKEDYPAASEPTQAKTRPIRTLGRRRPRSAGHSWDRTIGDCQAADGQKQENSRRSHVPNRGRIVEHTTLETKRLFGSGRRPIYHPLVRNATPRSAAT